MKTVKRACPCFFTESSPSSSGRYNKHKQDVYSVEDPSPSNSAVAVQHLEAAHRESVLCVCPVSAGTTASGGADNAVVIYDYQKGEVVKKWTGHEKEVKCLCYSAEAEAVFSGSRDLRVCMWRMDSDHPVAEFEKHDLVVSAIDIDTDNKLLCTGSRDNSVRLYDIPTTHTIGKAHISRNLVTCVAWLPNSMEVAQTSEDKTLKLWDMRRLEVIHTSIIKQYIQTSCAVSPDGLYCLTTSNGFGGHGCEATLWDLRQRQLLHEFKGHEQTIGACAFVPTPEGSRYLVATCSSDALLKIWDRDTARCLSTVCIEGGGQLTGLAAFDNGELCCSSVKSGIHVVKFDTAQTSGNQLLARRYATY